MTPTIYRLKRDFDTQKAERFFKERRVRVQIIDLAKSAISPRTLSAAAQSLGPDKLLDQNSNAYKECPARFSGNTGLLLDHASRDPRMLKLPIVKDGARFTVGYCPDEWSAWIAADER